MMSNVDVLRAVMPFVVRCELYRSLAVNVDELSWVESGGAGSGEIAVRKIVEMAA